MDPNVADARRQLAAVEEMGNAVTRKAGHSSKVILAWGLFVLVAPVALRSAGIALGQALGGDALQVGQYLFAVALAAALITWTLYRSRRAGVRVERKPAESWTLVAVWALWTLIWAGVFLPSARASSAYLPGSIVAFSILAASPLLLIGALLRREHR